MPSAGGGGRRLAGGRPAALTSSPFWPSSTLRGNRGREQGGFLLAGLLAGIWREGEGQTRRERESKSGNREEEEGSGDGLRDVGGCLVQERMQGGVARPGGGGPLAVGVNAGSPATHLDRSLLAAGPPTLQRGACLPAVPTGIPGLGRSRWGTSSL